MTVRAYDPIISTEFLNIMDELREFPGTDNGKEIVVDGKSFPGSLAGREQAKDYIREKYKINSFRLKLKKIYPYYASNGNVITLGSDGREVIDITNNPHGVTLAELNNQQKEATMDTTMLEALRAENEFLHEELQFQQAIRDLELTEAVLDCVSKEGGVSSSLETMFGENAACKDMFVFDVQNIHDSLEVFIKDQFNAFLDRQKTDAVIKALKAKFAALRKVAEEKGDNINFPIHFSIKNVFKLAEELTHGLQKAANLCVEKKYDDAYDVLKEGIMKFNKEDFKGVTDVEKESIKDYEQFQEVLKDGEQHMLQEFNEITIQANDIRKVLKDASFYFRDRSIKITPSHIERVVSFSVRLFFRTYLRCASTLEKAVRTGNPERHKENDLHIGVN